MPEQTPDVDAMALAVLPLSEAAAGPASTAAPTNRAAVLAVKRSRFVVGPMPYPTPGPGEIVVRNRAVAINPIDWITQALGDLFFAWIKYPFVLGSDSAGAVVAIGSGVTRFQPGDRVLGHAVGVDKAFNSAAAGSFQLYTVLLETMAAPIPDTLDFAQAAVLPLALSTAACGLFQDDQLALQHPSLDPVPTGKTLLIWGGSTSVGCNAIQLAVAAGYEVFATASPKNFALLRQLGAAQLFDYRSPTVVAELIAALRDRKIAGALALGAGSAGPCLDIVHASTGDKIVSMASTPVSFETVPLGRGRGRWLLPTMARMMGTMLPLLLKARRGHIRLSSIFSTSIAGNAIGAMIYAQFLPAALAAGRYQALPPAEIFGTGLEQIQPALDAHKRGVSARKLVVLL